MESDGEGQRDNEVGHEEAEDLADAESEPDVDGAEARVEPEELQRVRHDHDDTRALQADANLDGVVAAVRARVVDEAFVVVPYLIK